MIESAIVSMIEQVFVSHYPPLEQRRRWLEAALNELGFKQEWLTQFDKRHLTNEFIFQFYNPSPALWSERASRGGALQKPPDPRVLSKAEVANAITHIYVYKQMAERGLDVALILEDDVIFQQDFRQKLENYLKQLPEDWDVLFPGSGCSLRLPTNHTGGNVIQHPRQESRTADCYLLRGKAAQKLVASMIPFVLPIDWELNYHFHRLNLNVYWAEPSIAFQGTERGVYESSADLIRVYT